VTDKEIVPQPHWKSTDVAGEVERDGYMVRTWREPLRMPNRIKLEADQLVGAYLASVPLGLRAAALAAAEDLRVVAALAIYREQQRCIALAARNPETPPPVMEDLGWGSELPEGLEQFSQARHPT
jgi:hypothetical protein